MDGVEKLETNVRVSLGRTLNSHGYADPWHLVITDEASGTQILEMRFSNDTMADLIAGTTATGLPADLIRSVLHGKKSEHETHIMPLPEDHSDWGALQDEWYAKLEAEGWHMQRDERYNGHRRAASGEGYEVHCTRWV